MYKATSKNRHRRAQNPKNRGRTIKGPGFERAAGTLAKREQIRRALVPALAAAFAQGKGHPRGTPAWLAVEISSNGGFESWMKRRKLASLLDEAEPSPTIRVWHRDRSAESAPVDAVSVAVEEEVRAPTNSRERELFEIEVFEAYTARRKPQIPLWLQREIRDCGGSAKWLATRGRELPKRRIPAKR